MKPIRVCCYATSPILRNGRAGHCTVTLRTDIYWTTLQPPPFGGANMRRVGSRLCEADRRRVSRLKFPDLDASETHRISMILQQDMALGSFPEIGIDLVFANGHQRAEIR